MGYRAIITQEDMKQNVIQFQETTKIVDTIKELKEEVENIVSLKNAKGMYRDSVDGKVKKIGWTKSTWEKYDDTGTRYNATYWIEVQEVKEYVFGDN